MKLLIDSGNSFIKWSFATDEEFINGSTCPTTSVSSLQKKWAGDPVPARVIVSNVAGDSVASKLRKVVDELWQLDAEFLVSSRNCCGLVNSYNKPEQLGIDRWMAMLAAFQEKQDPVIVIDCGTAVTIDLVNEDGLFVGGLILPGLYTAYKSLMTDTAAVEAVSDIKTLVSATAVSTEEGVQAGILFGLVGAIERVVREQSASIEKKPVVFITGGDAERLMPYLEIPAVFQSDLVLQGLRIYSEEN